MLCPTCHGRHWIIVNSHPEPCPECGGIGEVHCCDGLCRQSAFSNDGESGLATEHPDAHIA